MAKKKTPDDSSPAFAGVKVRRVPVETALAEFLPTLLIDSREQTPLEFRNLPSRRLRGDDSDVGLTTGDYSIEGFRDQFIIERKSLADLIGCLVGDNAERFQRELHRAQAYEFAAVVVTSPLAEVEAGVYRSNLAPKAALARLASFQVRYRVPFHFFSDPEQAARQVERWTYYYVRGKLHLAESLTEALAPKSAVAG